MVMILFLDFDGVTHPQPCFHENVLCRLHLIEKVLRERELRGIQIVISSSWKEHYSLHDMREFFSNDIQSRVIGVTPDISKLANDTGQSPDFERERECESWMQTNCPPGTPWLAIDDRPEWFSPDCENLLVTNCQFGFSAENATRLRDMLWDRL